MQEAAKKRPSIHVTLLPGVDTSLYRWVQIGAEEEGVPCRKVDSQQGDVIANAFAASQSSRFNIGVAVGTDQVVLHESHMPPGTPVLVFDVDGNLPLLSRLMGCNAARMIIRKPFRFDDKEVDEMETDPSTLLRAAVSPPPPRISQPLLIQANPANNELDPAQLKALVTVIVRKLLERGVQ